MALPTTYQWLEPRAQSNYCQLFVRGRSLRAETLYRATIGAEPRTPKEVATDFGVPLAAVHEAIHYSLHEEELLRQEREAGLVDISLEPKPEYVETMSRRNTPLYQSLAAHIPEGTTPADYLTSLDITARKPA